MNFEQVGEEVKEGEVYSTDEQLIGTWIDGRPLYRRFVDCGAIPSGQQNQRILYTFQNIRQIYLKFALTDDLKNLPYVNPNDASAELAIILTYNSSAHYCDVRLMCRQDRSSFGHIYVCVEYTKMTD